MNMQAEFEFLVQFIRQNDFDVEICRDQLRVLWTAYCLHYNMTVDTGPYDLAMRELWSAAAETEEDTAGRVCQSHWPVEACRCDGELIVSLVSPIFGKVVCFDSTSLSSEGARLLSL